MGKSRSATILIAFLLYSSMNGTLHRPWASPSESFDEDTAPESPSLDPHTALALVRQSRPFAEPNEGFMAQLQLYHRMGCPTDLDSHPEYQRWLYRQAVEESNRRGVAPEVEDILFGDEAKGPTKEGDPETRAESASTATTNQHATSPTPPSSSNTDTTPSTRPLHAGPKTTYRCRRCRQPLGASAFTTSHSPPPLQQKDGRGTTTTTTNTPSPASSTQCAHIFLQPLSWMRPELEQGKLDGRLECPNGKCRTQVGRYAWQGIKCSCGRWEVPGLGLARGKVDEVADRGPGAARAGGGPGRVVGGAADAGIARGGGMGGSGGSGREKM